MAKFLTVDFDGEWVLKHKGGGVLPVAAVCEVMKEVECVSVEYKSFTHLVLNIGTARAEDIEDIIECVLKKHYPDDNIQDIVSFIVDERETEDGEEAAADAAEEDGEDDFDEEDFAEIDNETIEEIINSAAEENSSDGGAEIIAKIDGLAGAGEFKSLVREIGTLAPQIIANKTYDVFAYQSYLFSIGEGNGLSTYLEMFAAFLRDSGLRKIRWTGKGYYEISLPAVKDSYEPFENVERILKTGSENAVAVLCIDISEWMNATDNRFFKTFLRSLENSMPKFTVVFRIPFVDKDVLEKIKYSLGDLLTVRAVSFPPFTNDEIKLCAKKEFESYGFTVSDGIWNYFNARISEEKSDGKFYGLKTVKKVVREILYGKQLDNAGRGKDEKRITAKDAKLICRGAGASSLSGLEELEKLVGNEAVKKKINEIIAQIELSLKAPASERPCLHMRFTGNPGTGKTTVARILGKILKEKGVLRVGNFYEVVGRDFVGRYIGETAPKTASICRDAYGSVLFIDEAYSLYRGDGDSKDFGREALDTLIAEMENHRGDFVVIMAGYTDEMDTLMRGNTGLASRMPHLIEFPNFTREELYGIFENMVKSRFKCEDKVFERAREYFNGLPDELLSSKEFSNARFVRNLFERTWAKASMRCQLDKKAGVTITKDDFERASAEKEFTFISKNKTRIGF